MLEDDFEHYILPYLMRLALVSSGFRAQVVFNCRKIVRTLDKRIAETRERSEAFRKRYLRTTYGLGYVVTPLIEAEREMWSELTRQLTCGCDQSTIEALISPFTRICPYSHAGMPESRHVDDRQCESRR